MPFITFQNILDEESDFTYIESTVLANCVYEYAKTLDPELYDKVLHQKVTVTINGKVIHPDNWCTTVLDDEDKVVLVPTLEGGKNAGMWQIAVGIAIIMISAGAGTPGVVGWWTAGYAIGASLVLGGVSSLLFQPDLPSAPGIDGSRQTQTYNWSGISTTSRPDIPIPIVYGTHAVGGNVLSAFVDVYESSSYLNVLLGLCEGEIEGICHEDDITSVCTTSDPSSASYPSAGPAIKVNDQPLRNYDNVEWWYRTGTNQKDESGSKYPFDPTVQNKIPHFNSVRMQNDDGREINSDGIEYTTTKEVDMLTLQVNAPVLYESFSGGIREKEIRFSVEWKAVGGAYATLDIDNWAVDDVVGSNGANSIHCTCTTYSTGYYKSGDEPQTVIIEVVNNDFEDFDYTTEPESTSGTTKVSTITFNILDEAGNIIDGNKTVDHTINRIVTEYDLLDESGESDIWGGLEHVYQTTIVVGYLVTLDYEVKPGDRFTLSSTQTGVTTDEVFLKGKTKTGLWGSVTLDFNELGVGKDAYVIKLTRTDGGPSTAIETADQLVLKSVIEVVQGQFIYPNTAVLGLRMKATNQLSGSIPNIVTTIKGMKVQVPSLSGSEEFDDCFYSADNSRFEYGGAERTWDNTTYETEFSNNAILCVRDVVISTRYGLGDYISLSDLYNTSMITAIKECHTAYTAHTLASKDYISWWDGGTDDTWATKILYEHATSNLTITLDSSARTFQVASSGTNNKMVSVYAPLDEHFEVNATYTISLTLSGVTGTINTIHIYGTSTGGTTASYLGVLSGKGNGTHTLSVTPTRTGLYLLKFTFVSYLSTLAFTITDVSLVKTTYDRNHTWDGVLESGQSALTVLREMCESFRCWPVWMSGAFNFVIDTNDTPIHTLTMGNLTSFNQAFTPLSDIPYIVEGQFTDEDNDYELRSVTIRSTLDTLTKLNKRTIGLKGITSRVKAERELKRKLDLATQATHTVNFKCGLDMLHGTAGDIINIQNDLPSWGQGGRVIDYNLANATVFIDTPYTFTNAATDTHLMKYQLASNVFVTGTVASANLVSGTEYQNIPLESWMGTPCDSAPYALGKSTSYVKKFRLVSVNRTLENEVEGIGLEHIASVYSATTVTTIENISPRVIQPMDRPGPPTGIYVTNTDISEGVGFLFRALPPWGNPYIKEIVVQMAENNSSAYRVIATIPADSTEVKYVDNNLSTEPPNNIYNFRFFCRTLSNRSGPYVQVSYTLSRLNYSVPKPTGLRIRGVAPNNSTFLGKDITVEWDSVGMAGAAVDVIGYKVEVRYADPTVGTDFTKTSNILRTVYVSGETYTYTYSNLMEDTGGTIHGTSGDVLSFVVYTNTRSGILSAAAGPLAVYNTVPDDVTGLTAVSVVGGVAFHWDKSDDEDWKSYSVKTKLGSGGYSDWEDVQDNYYLRQLTSSEVVANGNKVSITISVRAKDWYGQYSTAVEASGTSDTVSDNIFSLTAIQSGGGTGTVASLYDGVLDSGGLTFA